MKYGAEGAEFTFAKRYDSPTMATNFKFFFGHIEYVVQAAPGVGIVSSMVLLSDDLDEIDWEVRGTDTAHIETNYFGKGYLNYGIADYVQVTTPQTLFHTYSLDWSATSLVWSIDGVAVRTLKASDAGEYFPQTPMKVSLSLWDGGDPSEAEGTSQWAGGITPIPPPENYTMYVKSVKIENANPGSSYEYMDKSGSYQSIKVTNATTNVTSSSTSMTSSTPLASAVQHNSLPSAPFVPGTGSALAPPATGTTAASASPAQGTTSALISPVPSTTQAVVTTEM